MTKFKAFEDDKLNVVRLMLSLLNRVENTVGKGENAGYQHFLLFLQSFPKPSSLGSLKVRNVWCRVKQYFRSQCNYPSIPEVLFTSTPHNIPSKPLAAFT